MLPTGKCENPSTPQAEYQDTTGVGDAPSSQYTPHLLTTSLAMELPTDQEDFLE